jgi:hypothetical protein
MSERRTWTVEMLDDGHVFTQLDGTANLEMPDHVAADAVIVLADPDLSDDDVADLLEHLADSIREAAE